jgi:prevent-host-death family protein
MKTIELSKARGSLAKYARELNHDSVVVTVNDKPVAALIPLEDEDWESIRVATNPKFIELIRQSRQSLRTEGGISSDEVRKRLGLKPGKPRKRRRP